MVGREAPEQRGGQRHGLGCVLRLALLPWRGQSRGRRARERLLQVPARRWQEQGKEVDGLKMVVWMETHRRLDMGGGDGSRVKDTSLAYGLGSWMDEKD